MTEWRFASAVTVGLSHKRTETPCQDRVLCEYADGVLVAVAADGAGSAKHSDDGADVVVRSVTESLQHISTLHPDALLDRLRVAIDQARSAVVSLAEARSVPIREFACTLLVVVATDNGTACAHLGDGVIAVCDGGEEWSWVFWPQRGEYANTTRFMTDADAMSHLNIEIIRSPITDFAIMTDGLEPLALDYASQVAHNPFFNSILKPLHRSSCIGCDAPLSDALLEFLNAPRVTDQVDDDLSIIIASRRPSTSPGS